MTDNVYVGNAALDAAGDRGWLLGHFKPVGNVRHSEDVEIKWGVHPQGDQRPECVTGEKRTALLILISGRFRVEIPGRSVVLADQGDYVVWGQGVEHSWYAEEKSVVMTVRWPSMPGYAVEARDAAVVTSLVPPVVAAGHVAKLKQPDGPRGSAAERRCGSTVLTHVWNWLWVQPKNESGTVSVGCGALRRATLSPRPARASRRSRAIRGLAAVSDSSG